MRTTLATIALALLAACGPTQHDEARWGRRQVALGAPLDPVNVGPWRDDQLAALRQEIPALSALGPTVAEGPEGDPATFVLRPFDSTLADPAHRPCGAGAGRWTPGTNEGECDPACAQGTLGLQACFGHEFGHANGLRHVTGPGEAACADCDPRVAPAYAMMNPRLGYDDPGLDPTATVDPGAVPQTDPTLADLQEWNLAHADAGP